MLTWDVNAEEGLYKTQCQWESVTHSLSQTSLGSVPVKVSLMSQKSFHPLSILRRRRFTQTDSLWIFGTGQWIIRWGLFDSVMWGWRCRLLSRHVIAPRLLMFTSTDSFTLRRDASLAGQTRYHLLCANWVDVVTVTAPKLTERWDPMT